MKKPHAGSGLIEMVQKSLDDDKAEDLVNIELAGKSTIADHMVIATGRSSRQVSAMADHLVRSLKQAGVRGIGVEGMRRGDWVLVDAGDIIIHLFRPEVREFYGLEKMWTVEPMEDVPTSHVGGESRSGESRTAAG